MQRITRKRKRNLMLAIAVAAIAAGLVVASVSANGGHHRGGTAHAHKHANRARANRSSGSVRRHPAGQRALAAQYLGLTSAQLHAQLRSGRTLAQIADATSGKSAQGLVEALVNAGQQARLASLRSRITLKVNGVSSSLDLPAATSYLGVSARQLRGKLHSGRSLAQIAGATSGKSATGLVDALVSAGEAEAKAAVASGALAPAATSAYLSNLRRRITREVDRTRGPASKR